MAEARQRDHWQHTSALLWMLYEINRDPKSPAKTPDDFNPHAIEAKARETPLDVGGLSALRTFFTGVPE